MMSIHAAKGLEFKKLFIIGFEEGFFPIVGDGSDLEEERRLGYVAIRMFFFAVFSGLSPSNK
jgi:DNA helicase-2/ATP-dependent DNA helicase PcrA